jgi:hypothetical protein
MLGVKTTNEFTVKINNDGVAVDAQHRAGDSFIQGLRSKAATPSRFVRAIRRS